jgi:hypothetical protein
MRVFILAALIPIIASPALAQEALQKQLYGCARIEEAGQRHQCFDGLVPEIRKAGEASFGSLSWKPSPLTAPLVAAPSAKTQSAVPPLPEKVSLAVKSVSTGSDGKMKFTMENGQIWRQVDAEKVRNLGKGPWTAEIRKAAMGSFMLTINGGRSVRVQRVN